MSDATLEQMLAWLGDNCITVSIDMNDRASEYMSVTDAILEIEEITTPAWAAPDEKQRCIDGGQLWCCQVYPDTPVSFYHCFASTLERAVRPVYDAIRAEREVRNV